MLSEKERLKNYPERKERVVNVTPPNAVKIKADKLEQIKAYANAIVEEGSKFQALNGK